MSAFSDMYEAAVNPILHSAEVGFVEASVTYTHKADPVNSLAESGQTYAMGFQSSTDVGGGSRQLQQPATWRVRSSTVVRAPRRGDEITFDGETWTVFDVTHKRAAGEYRLSVTHHHTRG